MGRYKIVDDNGIYFTTHTIVEWLAVFREREYFEILTRSLNYCQEWKAKGETASTKFGKMNTIHSLSTRTAFAIRS